MDEQELNRLIRQRSQVSIDLQIMEMADGYEHMKASRLQRAYRAIDQQIEQARKELEAEWKRLNKSPPHSPVPFCIGDSECEVVAENDYELVVFTDRSGRPDYECIANAEFIVRACNHHDDLLAAIDGLTARMAECGLEHDPVVVSATALTAKARQRT